MFGWLRRSRDKAAGHVTKAVIMAVGLLLSGTTPGYCAYVVESKIEGEVCRDWVIFSSCYMVDIDAIDGEDGHRFTSVKRFETVDEFSAGRCFIRVHYDGWIAWLMRRATGPVFLTKLPDGTYEKADIEYIAFKCSEEK